MFNCTFSVFILLFFSLQFMTDALPIQSVFSQNNMQSLEYTADKVQDWDTLQKECSMYQSVIEHYESIVDLTLSSESEDLLYNLIHLPKKTLHNILYLQSQLIGVDLMTENKLSKIPSIIGKHIGEVNKSLYVLVEKVVTISWNSLWNSNMLRDDDQLLSFLSSVNIFIGKSLVEGLNNYKLLERIKSDIEQVNAYGDNSLFSRLKETIFNFYDHTFVGSKIPDIEIDFLRQHLRNIRSGLLVELDMQFMDFFIALKNDSL